MARCRCSGNTCGCELQAGQGIMFSGSGNVGDPFVISAPLAVVDTPDINLTLSGFNLSGIIPALHTGTTGQVLTKQADGTWAGAPGTTAAAGSIILAAGGGLAGAGTVASPLRLSGLCTYASMKAHCT